MNDNDSNMAANAIAHSAYMAQEMVRSTLGYYEMPSVLFRPKLYPDGNMWCALYGDNLQDGCAGFGETPAKAMQDFDLNWQTMTIKHIDEPRRRAVPSFRKGD